MSDPLRTAHTFELDPATLGEIRALLDDAFDGSFSEEDWTHGLGGVHVLVRDGAGALVAHGSVIQRRLTHAGRSYRVGYVEAVAVRPDRRRDGLGGRVLEVLERVVDRAYDVGALSASETGSRLYRSRGWHQWEGRVEVLSPDGVVRLPEEEGATFLWPVPDRELPSSDDALIFDWRDGDVL
ncbi:aminoglycoside 2'-N-acetyltransferase [Streptomyces camponoticapitis]|uniref:Aminoglycoside 2'-N-acetyltransferase n=1 Tax=Streptomyces camponoticapitis TaxID=1616125 RepID=A0ABQ2DUS4_9ACTN|nr:GNAT family N-acetyltransferase [Streptomyces camponoticapitis]GGJ74081.1 aminoglycoside 2'-N-acetyltransferase [Streptomyces camponoticapitis]